MLALVFSYFRYKRTYDVGVLVTGIVGSLVSITAGCVVIHLWESMLVGAIGSLIVCLCMPLVKRIGIDDPVGVISVHGLCALWGILAVGLFAHGDDVLDLTQGLSGVFYSGDPTLLGVQSLLAVCCAVWSAMTSLFFLLLLRKLVGLRMTEVQERLGSNIHDHGIDLEQKCDTTFQVPDEFIPPLETIGSLRHIFKLIKKYTSKWVR
ncbi:amt-3 (predicted) [Pycnogonum litorale]